MRKTFYGEKEYSQPSTYTKKISHLEKNAEGSEPKENTFFFAPSRCSDPPGLTKGHRTLGDHSEDTGLSSDLSWLNFSDA